MKKILAKIALMAMVVAPFAAPLTATAATTWNMTGSYVFAFNLGGIYSHDVSIVQDASGNITGTGGGYPAGGVHVYTWVIDSGSVVGNVINFTAHYTATPDAVVPLTTMNVVGTIAPDGTMSGTWSDNYQGGVRIGTWATTSGIAANCSAITLVSSTSTQFKHLTTLDPVGSSLDSLFTSGTPGAAVLTGPDGFAGAWDAAAADPDVAGAIWVNNIATAPTPGGAGDGQNGSINVWRLFSHTFSIPTGAVVSSAMLHLAADNSVQAFLDNSGVGSAPNFNAVVDLPLTVTPGPHELEFVTKNDAFNGDTNPTGVIYRADINYCAPITTEVVGCPAAPSVANKILKEKGLSAKVVSEKNYISQVAKFMGPQTYFNTVAACNTSAYKTAVDAYLHGLGAF